MPAIRNAVKHFSVYFSLTLLLAMLSANTASAQVKPEQAIGYRKAAYHVIVWNWSPMAGMVRGAIPYDKAKFARNARRIAQIAPALLEGFPAGSDKGAATEALPAIWQDWADFQAKMKTFETESAVLSKVSGSADFERIKVQFAKVGEACKACHQKYKAE